MNVSLLKETVLTNEVELPKSYCFISHPTNLISDVLDQSWSNRFLSMALLIQVNFNECFKSTPYLELKVNYDLVAALEINLARLAFYFSTVTELVGKHLIKLVTL